jgi:hypothetical protein
MRSLTVSADVEQSSSRRRFHRSSRVDNDKSGSVSLPQLPNYEDVAPAQVSERGLFSFGPEYRPVPSRQQVSIGVIRPKDRFKEKKNEPRNMLRYYSLDSLHRGYQVMVFVH